jgi:hypothetical protein
VRASQASLDQSPRYPLFGVFGQRQQGRQQHRLVVQHGGGIQAALQDQCVEAALLRARHGTVIVFPRHQHAVAAHGPPQGRARLARVDLERQRGRRRQRLRDARRERINTGLADVQGTEQQHRMAVESRAEQGAAVGRAAIGRAAVGRVRGQAEQGKQEGKDRTMHGTLLTVGNIS